MSPAPVALKPNRRRAADYQVRVARTLDDLARVNAVRALVYMADQACPYEEEFDGNDLCGATHLLLSWRGEPAGVVRLRWFGEFAKLERLAVRQEHRGGPGLLILCNAAFEHAARKGYRKLIGHAQVRGEAFWRRYFDGRPRAGRPRFRFSQYEYVEMEFDLAAHPKAVGLASPAMVLLRPEGAWDEPGVLEAGYGELAA